MDRPMKKNSCRTIVHPPTSVYLEYFQFFTRISDSRFLIGDRRGPRYSVYDLCHPGTPQDAQPPTAPRLLKTEAHKPHELELIRGNGGFVNLPEDVPDEIVRCYFRHVHFMIPVLNAKEFLDEYYYNGFQNINPLLMWSMCLASANVRTIPYRVDKMLFLTADLVVVFG